MSQLLSFNSELDESPKNINIKLKKHQLAMLKRCKDIEKIDDNKFGIMNDKPGTGKTYVILSLIYESLNLNKTNIIVVPQNIYSQWITSIENFSKKISFRKFINYDNIISLYNDPKILSENDIIITTSSYYHTIATTLASLEIKINRVFFDEIDSISNIICTKINSDFIWFVSASFNIDYLGYYKGFLTNMESINNITCKCDNDFIDANIFLDQPIKTYCLCKNIYIDNILGDVISNKELKCLNAMDYTMHDAKNEKEIIDFILHDKKSLTDFDKIKVEDANKNIELYENFRKNKDENEKLFHDELLKISIINEYKDAILHFISYYENYTNFYVNVVVDDKDGEQAIQKSRREEIKILVITYEDINEILYNISDINEILNKFIINKKNIISVNNTILNLKKIVLMILSIYEILFKIKNDVVVDVNSDIVVDKNDIFSTFYDTNLNAKNYINNLLELISNFENSVKSDEQLEINNKILAISSKNIEINESKINLIYERLSENECCPVCYEEFESMENTKIYITSTCCNHKICGDCVEQWYSMGKESCIFCNKSEILIENLLFFEKEIKSGIKKNTSKTELNENLINNEQIIFEVKNHSKNIFIKKYIEQLKNENKKIIIFSDYTNIFEYIQDICNENDIIYTDLDKGNMKDIDNSVNEYKVGNAKILLSNSKLFGCGMNFENSTDIIFVHKMDKEIEEQVIGRAQRMGRKNTLNIIYLEYENESTFVIPSPKQMSYKNMFCDNDELIDFYNEKQYYNIIDNINIVDFTNEIDIPSLPIEPIDVNLETLISSL